MTTAVVAVTVEGRDNALQILLVDTCAKGAVLKRLRELASNVVSDKDVGAVHLNQLVDDR